MKNTRVPTPPAFGAQSQHAMLVHSADLDGVTDVRKIERYSGQAINAVCLTTFSG